MNIFPKRLNEAMEKRGKKAIDIAKETGISRGTISNYLKGEFSPKQINTDKLAKCLNVNIPWLLGADVPMELQKKEPETLTPIKLKTKKITVYGSIPAGVPVECIEDIIGEFEFPANFLNNGAVYIGLKVKGDSMKPDYLDGDILAIRLQPDCETGQIAAVYVNGYDATLKKVIKKENALLLEPLNKEYETQVFIGEEMEQIKIMGVVDAMFRTNKK